MEEQVGLGPKRSYGVKCIFLKLCVTCFIFSACVAGATNHPPNVVFIYADDLGYADIGYNAPAGSLAYTPNIDRICNEGIYLSNYLTHHVCTPSRAGVLTGRHYTRVGAGINVNGTLDNSVPNIAKDFQAAGYATGCFGKWHSSDPNEPTNGKSQVVNYNDVAVYSDVHQMNTAPLDNGLFDKSFPRAWGEGVNAYGFDRYVGFYSGLVDYFDKFINFYHDVNWWHDGDYVPDEPGYLTDLLSQHSLAFVETNQANPFFCYVPHGCVHAPYDIMRSDLEEMCNIIDDEHPTLAWTNVMMLASPLTGALIRDADEMRCTPDFEFDREALDGQINGFADLVYYTMIYSMDKSVGAMLDKLDELVAVGTVVTDRPPHRSVRATLTHTAPTSSNGVLSGKPVSKPFPFDAHYATCKFIRCDYSALSPCRSFIH
ncbi:sulfatase-like hydrolase/transferase [Pontiella sulfatireligans]|uniref:Arylsulfatase n=1 Tax=Pontiella sulfatireligans TaxID=2750658 RepID=A0A6C2UFM4_9BACT|nr:sulfatase-like hydrolase/transferase [Pontiella sulfatireligans]SPS74276.1 sulfatase S1_N.C [Kiritimatiellales bacterium]VGO18970.1 Arylsulfatase [Pontiella sulfatireligans]